MVVAWTRNSIESRWVQEEAEEGLQRHVLVPVLFDSVQAPIGFRGIQTADLSAWNKDHSLVELTQLLTDIRSVLGTAATVMQGATLSAAAHPSASSQIEVTQSRVTAGVIEPLETVTRAQITNSLLGMRGAGSQGSSLSQWASLQYGIMEAASMSGACKEEWQRLNDHFPIWMLMQRVSVSDSTVLGFTCVTLELTIHIVNRGRSTRSIHLELPFEGTVSDPRWAIPEEPLRYRMNVPDGGSAVRTLRPSAEETLSLNVQLWPEIEYSHGDVQGDHTLRRLRTASAFVQYLTSEPLGPFVLPDTELNNPKRLAFEVQITRNRNLLGFQPIKEMDQIWADWQRVRDVGIKESLRQKLLNPTADLNRKHDKE